MSSTDGSSRYLIYSLLKRYVDVHDHAGKKTSGIVQRVYRNVMDGVVEMTMGGRQFTFAEPAAIELEGNEVVFIYGSLGAEDDSDEALFREARIAAHAGESMDDVLRRTTPARQREMRFRFGPKAIAPCRYARV